ncbi:MAG: prepilin-type N-terminal cleavage/methylation domain-containing protein [Planctomycetaceae bacterium]|nr:prepilin-type N-terminal cleavage/methylation domain-containing protein [Planctomycetaceae bacterium]
MSQSRKAKSAGNKGFTLIELLVVIAIIALLLSVLLPSLRKAKKQAQSVLCLSQLRQWGTLYTLYASDYNSHLPAGWNSKKMWMTELMAYYQDTDDLRLCPAARKFLSQTGTAGSWWTEAGEFSAWGVYGENGYPTPYYGQAGQYGSYSVNSWALDPLEVGLPGTYNVPKNYPYYDNFWRKFSNAKSPSQVPLMGAGMWEGASPLETDAAPPSQGVQAPTQNAVNSGGLSTFCLDRHSGGPNWLFMDNQVRKVGMKELWRLKWHTQWDNSISRSLWPEWMLHYPEF